MKLNCQTTLENKSIKYWNRKRAESRMKGVRQEYDCIYQCLSRLSLYILIYLSSFNLSMYTLPIYPIIFYTFSIFLSINLPYIYIYLSNYLSLCIYLSIYVIYLSTHLYLSIYISIHLSVFLSISMYLNAYDLYRLHVRYIKHVCTLCIKTEKTDHRHRPRQDDRQTRRLCNRQRA